MSKQLPFRHLPVILDFTLSVSAEHITLFSNDTAVLRLFRKFQQHIELNWLHAFSSNIVELSLQGDIHPEVLVMPPSSTEQYLKVKKEYGEV